MDAAVVKSIFHITSAAEVARAMRSGEYRPGGFAREGFIHCSHRAQVVPVANRLFHGRTDLVLLEIEPATLACEVREENLEGGSEQFPHVYGPLPMSAVARVYSFPCDADGGFALPAMSSSA
jgi:uncharacterized protein (DUF952 family)